MTKYLATREKDEMFQNLTQIQILNDIRPHYEINLREISHFNKVASHLDDARLNTDKHDCCLFRDIKLFCVNSVYSKNTSSQNDPQIYIILLYQNMSVI